MTVAAILLAAGASRRMGEPKPLLAWGDTTLIQFEYGELAASCVDEIVIVCGHRMEHVRRALGEAERHVVFNPRWPQGRSTSLATGASALLRPVLNAGAPRPDAVVVQNVDQPTRAAIIDRLVDELMSGKHDIVQPSYLDAAGAMHGGHPVVIAGRLLEELAAVTEVTLGLRAVTERHTPHRVPFEGEPAVWLDLDTPDVLDEARRAFGVAG
jgi:molybdenum cofactor cytidylyltransferase